MRKKREREEKNRRIQE